MPGISAAILVAATLAPGGARADWAGPGWYVVLHHEGTLLSDGPFGTQDQCVSDRNENFTADQPPQFSAECVYFSTKPDIEAF